MSVLIAIAGRPNVGKSTLYNRLVGGRPALVHDSPGLTRDRRYGEFDYFGTPVRLVDTGGLDSDAASDVIGAGIHRQAAVALDEADAVVFVVDARTGVTPADQEVATLLRKHDKPIFIAVNKADSAKREDLVGEFFRFGFGDVFPISAVHGRGIDDLLDAIADRLGLQSPPPSLDDDTEPAPRPDDDVLRVSFVGKPNAGKSSLLNRLLGTERSLVHHEPGTTTDPVDTPFSLGGRDYILIDTAGVRRKARIYEQVEKISVSMSLGQLRRTDVVVLVIDAVAGASEQDARLAGAILDAGAAVVVALNKSDLLGGAGAGKQVAQKARDEVHFLPFVPFHLVSALRGDGVVELMAVVDRVAKQHKKRITTAQLNSFYAEVCETHPPQAKGGRNATIYYVTQGGIRPPTFLVYANRKNAIDESYRRFLANQLRKRYGFEGTPLKIVVKGKPARNRAGKRKKR